MRELAQRNLRHSAVPKQKAGVSINVQPVIRSYPVRIPAGVLAILTEDYRIFNVHHLSQFKQSTTNYFKNLISLKFMGTVPYPGFLVYLTTQLLTDIILHSVQWLDHYRIKKGGPTFPSLGPRITYPLHLKAKKPHTAIFLETNSQLSFLTIFIQKRQNTTAHAQKYTFYCNVNEVLPRCVNICKSAPATACIWNSFYLENGEFAVRFLMPRACVWHLYIRQDRIRIMILFKTFRSNKNKPPFSN
jgi:hypothetical protein